MRFSLFIITILLFTTCNNSNKEEVKAISLKNKIRASNSIGIIIFPDRNKEISYKVLDVTHPDSILFISNFIKDSKPNYPEKFSSLPDGYFSINYDSDSILNIYFVLDSISSFQIFNEKAEYGITETGLDYLNKVYNSKDWGPKEVD